MVGHQDGAVVGVGWQDASVGSLYLIGKRSETEYFPSPGRVDFAISLHNVCYVKAGTRGFLLACFLIVL